MKNEERIYENASMRKTYVARVFDNGERITKEKVLNSLKPKWSEMHRDGHIHIHDLDAYGLTYNCLAFDLLRNFPYSGFRELSNTGKILKLFRYIKNLISKVGNEQSGGMSFANFDKDLSIIIKNIDVKVDDDSKNLLKEVISDFIQWCNDSHERMGQVSYYVTLNIGIFDDELSEFICETVLDSYSHCSIDVIKPNIVFKIKRGYNYNIDDPGRYLLEKALLCSSKKMIPTYILCDSEPNRDIDPEKLSIMGCRTRVIDDVHGLTGSIGRGNVDNVSINLPRLALESVNAMGEKSSEYYPEFKRRWLETATNVVEILLNRYERLLLMDSSDFPTVSKYNLWCEDFDNTESIERVFRHGTHSIGFIGLSEAMEILTGKKYYQDNEVYSEALEFVHFMRDFTDFCTSKYGMNFSLLATSGEFISGRFPELDGKVFDSRFVNKGYYTNSFHVDVDSGLTALEKIRIEGPFHGFCNGGCITYVEFAEAPLENVEGLLELIDCAVESGVHYLGFNYPLDICNECGEKGVFDDCPQCGSRSIKRIRRVSGYLEVLDYFVNGKKNEVRHRRRNR